MSSQVAARRRRSPSPNPTRFVGQTGDLEVTADAPKARFTALTITLEQNGKSTPLFKLGDPQAARSTRVDARSASNFARDRQARSPGSAAGPRPHRRHARPVQSSSTCARCRARTSKDFQVRLEPPRIAVLSTKHYVNHGGSELVVYRATPPDVALGRAGRRPRISRASRSRARRGRRSALKVAFFALLHDQPLERAASQAFARDEAGNEVTAPASSTTCSRSRSRTAASRSTTSSSIASCPTSSSTRRS